MTARKLLKVDEPMMPKLREYAETVTEGKQPQRLATIGDLDDWNAVATEAELIAGPLVVQAVRAVTARQEQLFEAHILRGVLKNEEGELVTDVERQRAEAGGSRECIKTLIEACSADVRSMTMQSRLEAPRRSS